MDKKELKESEARADNELTVADNHRYPISKRDIKQVKAYFSNRKDLMVKVESSVVATPQDLYKKYTAIFSRVSIGRMIKHASMHFLQETL